MLDTLSPSDTDHLSALLHVARDGGYRFTTCTPATHARVNARLGNEWAHDLAGVLGWSRPFKAGVLPEVQESALRAAGVLVPHEDGWRSTVRVSSLDGLLFLHSAFPTIAAESVFFGPDTYRFARAIRALRTGLVRRAVDVGCGAGPGAVLVARDHPQAEVFGVDINPEALRLTRVNANAAAVTVSAVHSDLLSGVDGDFDLIVANPPYMADPAGRAYRDGGGSLGAGLSLKIVGSALDRLAPGGTLLLYTGAAIVNGVDTFELAAAPLLDAFTWSYEEIDPDVFGEELEQSSYGHVDRIAAVVLVARRPG